jgi:tRNA1Val (adenine37-N6)-methyltransferase
VSIADGETLNRLAGDWKLIQLKKGHRFSTDDLMTAWEAAHSKPDAVQLLDIGSGIGSVGLLNLWRLDRLRQDEHAILTTVEVQELSLGLARRSIALNKLDERVTAHLGDLRSSPITSGTEQYDLVTGSPPYIPKEHGVCSPHPPRAAARLELHGSVFDYCRAAAASLVPDGRFVFCHAAKDQRPEVAVAEAGLTLLARRDVVFRSDQPPLISLFTCAFEGMRADHPPFVIRGADGLWTDEYLAMRKDMGTVVWNR